MHWVQNEQPVEYHVIQWRNSAFHDHDKLPKRKMLGGVSFDGGGDGGKSENIRQTGVQTAQPSFPHDVDENLFGCGLFEEGAYRDGKMGNSLSSLAGKKETASQGMGRDTLEVGSIQEAMAVCQKMSVEESPDTVKLENAATPAPEEKRSRPAFLLYVRKLGNGIQTFLRGMKQGAGRENAKKQLKKEKSGTRTITKEELAQIQTDRTYLLDSYNKHGERSTLGR